MYWLSPIELNVFCRSWGDSSCRLPCLEEDSDCGVSLFSHPIYNSHVTAAWFFSLPPIFSHFASWSIVSFCKVRTIYPKPTCSNRTKICSNRTFFIFSTCSNRTWAFCKSLIMNKNCLKNASHVNKCKNKDSVLSCFFSNFLLLENYQIWLLEKNELISHRTLPFWRLHAP